MKTFESGLGKVEIMSKGEYIEEMLSYLNPVHRLPIKYGVRHHLENSVDGTHVVTLTSPEGRVHRYKHLQSLGSRELIETLEDSAYEEWEKRLLRETPLYFKGDIARCEFGDIRPMEIRGVVIKGERDNYTVYDVSSDLLVHGVRDSDIRDSYDIIDGEFVYHFGDSESMLIAEDVLELLGKNVDLFEEEPSRLKQLLNRNFL